MNTVERVKALCKERKIPIYKLEKDLGYANGYIGQLKKGSFPDERLKQIAEYLDVSLGYLTTGEVDGGNGIEYDASVSYDRLLQIYTRGKNNLTPEEKIRLAQIILADRND
jgi:transcriptional regulator with XRE-family HTH domain